MNQTLQLAYYLAPDSAQFYPVMPFPGTAYYKWAEKNGYLASKNFTDWLNEKGGHQCVLNLPGLSPHVIEEFCERAVRKFHFRPRYFFYKIRQAFKNPTEGVRSVKSFIKFLKHLFSNKSSSHQFSSLFPISVPTDWYSEHQLPLGLLKKTEKAEKNNGNQ